MRFLIAFALLFAWPWSAHKESGTVEIQANGTAVAHFKKHFIDIPTCTGSPRAVSREWVEFVGKPGTTVKWSCK
jgi:hypothetical protein